MVLMIAWVFLLAFFFAQIEIQIEGSAGWAANLPTWRIEKHWLLDMFLGSRPLTGYHAWLFPFIALFFHFPFVFSGNWSWRAEARIISCIMLFWTTEDFLWFVLNPAYGLSRFAPAYIHWHKHWLWHAPLDYWTYMAIVIVMMWFSYAEDMRERIREEA
jgi:hypothetical protein